jgi:hypothetical protein
LTPGTPVIVPKLGRCEVVAPPADGKVEVRLGLMRATVPVAEVLLDSHRAARRAEKDRVQAEIDSDGKPQGPSIVMIDGVPAGGRATARTLDSTLDVRGQRVDEAVANVDRFLDESLMASRDVANRCATRRDPRASEGAQRGRSVPRGRAERGWRRRHRRLPERLSYAEIATPESDRRGSARSCYGRCAWPRTGFRRRA